MVIIHIHSQDKSDGMSTVVVLVHTQDEGDRKGPRPYNDYDTIRAGALEGASRVAQGDRKGPHPTSTPPPPLP